MDPTTLSVRCQCKLNNKVRAACARVCVSVGLIAIDDSCTTEIP